MILTCLSIDQLRGEHGGQHTKPHLQRSCVAHYAAPFTRSTA